MPYRTIAIVVSVGALLVGAGEAHAQKTETLRGYAEWIRGPVLIVDGQQVVVDASTRLQGLARQGVASLELGTEVVVTGVREPDGLVRAVELDARPNGASTLERTIIGLTNSLEQQWLAAGHVTTDEQGGTTSLGRVLDSGPAVDRVSRVVDRLLPPYANRRQYRVYVIDNAGWNAMAMANGSIWVFRGLLDAVDDDELAIVVGHEIAHVTHEHTRREFRRSLWVQGAAIAAALAANEVDNEALRLSLQVGASLAATGIGSRFSRDHEHQADRVGLRYAHEGGFDVRKAPRLWERFRERHGEDPRVLNAVFGSHPLQTDRIARLRQQIEWNYR
jgi:Zn-dependent protease with chaperone function